MAARNFHLIHAINSLPWHMRAQDVHAYLPQVIAYMSGAPKAFFDEDDDENFQAFPPDQKVNNKAHRFVSTLALSAEPYIESYYYDYLPVKVNNVVVIPAMGAITQEDYCGRAGTNTINAWYEKAAQDPEIVGVVELVNSPGGSVLGTTELATYKLTYPKPIVSLCQGLMASAAYFIASGSSTLLATSQSCIVGSIGTMTTWSSWKKYYAKNGIEIKDLYSSTSSLKNDASRRAEAGDFTGFTDGILFDLDQNFMGFVKDQRPDISQICLDGADMVASKALTEGLLDGYSTLSQAIEQVQELASKAQFSKNSTPNKTIMNKTTIKVSSQTSKILAGLGLAEIVAETESTGENPEEKKDQESKEEKPESGSNQEKEAEAKTTVPAAEQKESAEVIALKAALAEQVKATQQLTAKLDKLAGAPPKQPVQNGNEIIPTAESKTELTASKGFYEEVLEARRLS